MAVHDFQAQRLFIDAALAADAAVPCSGSQANYLLNVLRLKAGDAILVFNGRDGEWRARISDVKSRTCALAIEERVRAQETGPDIDYLFAPLKRARLDYMVQKATELGVARLRPVMTRRTVAERVNLDRLRANVIEAAEQCGILRIPEIAMPDKLERVLSGWDASCRLVFCDENAEGGDPLATLARLEPGAIALIVGPEGGFDPDERALLLRQPYTVPLSLGPRIMRADTAAVAALALINATLGDWC